MSVANLKEINCFFVFTCQVAYIPCFYSNKYLLLLSTVMITVQRKAELSSVADPDPGSGAFLTPRSGIRDG
jgi:hypothetical protein